MTSFTHKPTDLPWGDPEKDRVVVVDGRSIGRVELVEVGQQEGLWQWACFWVGTDTSGTAESLKIGLNEIKIRWSEEARSQLPPEPPRWNRGTW